MRASIRFKLTCLLVILMVITIVATTLVSNVVLPGYFERNMENSLANTFKNIHVMIENAGDNIDLREVVMSVSTSSHDAHIVIVDSEKRQNNVYTNINQQGRMIDSMLLLANLWLHQESFDDDSGETLDNSYYVVQQNHDNRLNADYYDLTGSVDDRYYVVIRRSVSFVKESAKAAEEVFMLVGLVATIIGSIAMMIVATSFATPIHNMAAVAKKMQDLDFDAKVSVKGNDEIAALGTAMNDLSERLEHTISELKSANAELSEDIEKKEQIDEMRKEFLSHVSHELKTPIALIQGYAEGLKENVSDDPESREFYCEVIMDEANKMNTMVKKILSLNELEFGNNRLDIQRFDIVNLAGNIIQSSEILMQNFKGKVTMSQKEPIYVWADEYMISEVFTNYLTNALNHVLPDGEIRIDFIQSEKEVRVQVFNTGEHIPEEDIDKVWVKFYKVDKARTREYGGSGIGLSIVSATMEAHNKDYGVENVEGGVAFYFCLDTDISC